MKFIMSLKRSSLFGIIALYFKSTCTVHSQCCSFVTLMLKLKFNIGIYRDRIVSLFRAVVEIGNYEGLFFFISLDSVSSFIYY